MIALFWQDDNRFSPKPDFFDYDIDFVVVVDFVVDYVVDFVVVVGMGCI